MHRRPLGLPTLCLLGLCGSVAAGPDDLPPFDKVSEGFEKVTSTADGQASLYGIWVDSKKNQMLAELPRGWESQKHFFAVTQASGGIFAGLQGPDIYVYWRRYDRRLALVVPQLETRSTGERESKSSVERLFTDTVLVDVPIIANGPSGQPVIDMDDLLVGHGGDLFGFLPRGMNARLTRIATAKAFPQNVELAFEVPVNGALTTFHYSISNVTRSSGYKPRVADDRVGYFTTDFRDLGQYEPDSKWVRYIDRWHLEKRDPKLTLSPPKEPITFYLEHTIPVRYRRWVRQGLLFWNDAFRKVGLDGAIEVLVQDEATGSHMDKDPEDVRYNFIRWLNNDVSTAIGPHRANPETGQILDADIVLTDGWIRAYWRWHQQLPELALEGMAPETLVWLEERPEWDPRVLLASPLDRERLLARRAGRPLEDTLALPDDPILREHENLAAIGRWLGEHQLCLAAHGMAMDVATARMHFAAGDWAGVSAEPSDTLDGLPEWFVGPLLADLTAHEVGHTLGLRHNFKASSVYSLSQINSEEFMGKKPLAGSVMDYLPVNFDAIHDGKLRGDITMIGVGPYDHWAIEYGYTFDDPKKLLARVSEPELAYGTDEDTSGCDPFARRYDFSADPLEWAQNQLALARGHRERILEKYVKDGQSWAKAREGYAMTLSTQASMLSTMANWLGGAHVHRDHKGDPGARAPLQVVDSARQQAALRFVIENGFRDSAFGLTPELLVHMTADKWQDRGDSAWPVHDQIVGLQSTALTMMLNPTTLMRVHDNEMRTPADQDALTLPGLIEALTAEIYSELDTGLDGATYTERKPMISSLRRNLQSAMTDRLVSLATGDGRMPRAIRTVSLHHLRKLDARLGKVMEQAGGGQLDTYSLAHLEDVRERVQKAINTVYVRGLQ